jgi:hypothetical protein
MDASITMPLIINELPKRENEVIHMGKQPVADYYPPGATEPIVRPADIPPPAVPESEVDESKSIKEAATTPPVAKTVKEEPKKAVSKKK